MGRFRSWLQNYIYRHLFNGVTEQDILKDIGGKLTYKGQTLTDEQVRGIISEAKNLSVSPLLTLLIAEMRLTANENIFNKSSSIGDLVAPKSVLWTVDVLEKKIRALADRRSPTLPKRS